MRIIPEKNTKLPFLRNQNWKTKQKFKKKRISTKNITELNDLIYAMAKSISDEICVLLKNTTRNSKPNQEIRLETQINLKKQKFEDRGKRRNMLGQKEKSNTVFKTTNITRENKSEGPGKRKKTKKIPR